MNKKIEFIEVKLDDKVIFNASSSSYLLQSMTNTDTNDIEATVSQILELIDAGADLVRVAVPRLKVVEVLRKIRRDVMHCVSTMQHKPVPLIADVHFLPKVAEKTAAFVDKIRINPGNFTGKCRYRACPVSTDTYQQGFETMASRAKPLFDICKKHDTVIRVGVNQGSLCKRILTKYGNTSVALVESALEWINMAELYDYHRIVFSIKSSHVKTMMDANLLLYHKMLEMGKVYPFHLGVTEAANEMEGRVKSAIGIGGLLLHGLGNTFRVSLTENPVHEIVFSKMLVEAIHDIKQNDYAHFSKEILTISYPEKNIEKWWGGVGALLGNCWLTHNIQDIIIENPHFSMDEIDMLRNCALQICGIKKTHTEIIACPSCGRTQYDIQTVLNAVKQQFSNFPHLKIAVMGCVVNGPGEMADADFGIVGCANHKVDVYKGAARISDFVSVPEALEILQLKIKN
jgi:(E)-4-hydroxy-3-methylbut-2-enyl-diphosphate synthase